MKRIVHFYVLLLVCLLAHVTSGQAVLVQNDKWTRVQTDTGELSVDVPEDFSYFFDLDGFTVGHNSTDYPVRDMRLLNAYRDGTLVSLEVYRADSDAMTGLLESTLDKGFQKKKTKFQGFDVRELVRTEDEGGKSEPFYFVSRFFRSKDFVYVVSGLSRSGGETRVMSRFFESIKFAPGTVTPTPDIRRLSELSATPVDIKTVPPSPPGKRTTPVTLAASTDPSYKAALIVSRPRAAYTNSARDKDVKGSLRLKIELGTNAFIPAIEIIRTLPDGLVRQAIFAALRLKFLPAERNGVPVKVKRTLEYTFDIY